MRKSYVPFAFSLAVVLVAGCSPSGSKVSIQNKGSDTMIEAAQAWAEAYMPASVEIAGGGSGVGIAALIAGTVEIANCSREMAESEVADAKAKTGEDPKRFVVGYDALAIYVPKDNPLDEISLEQLKEVWSEGGSIETWEGLGAKAPGCSSGKIELIGRQNNSGTFEYFREHVLGSKGSYRLRVNKASGSKDLVKTVGSTPCAMGYSGMGYKTEEVKFLKVKVGDKPGVDPSVEAVHDGSYPISRPLYMYTLGEPTGAVKEYLDWVRSDAGQAILEKIGYVPLSPAERTKPAAPGKKAAG